MICLVSCECEFGNLVLLQLWLIHACWCPDLLFGFGCRLQLICVMVGSCHMLVGAQICCLVLSAHYCLPIASW